MSSIPFGLYATPQESSVEAEVLVATPGTSHEQYGIRLVTQTHYYTVPPFTASRGEILSLLDEICFFRVHPTGLAGFLDKKYCGEVA